MPEACWTAKAVADALEEAAQTLRRLPAVCVRGYVSAWPPIIRDFWEAYGWHEAEVRLGPPAPDAIDRMDEVLRWLHWLGPNEVRMRAEGVRWKSIAHRFGMDRSTAWRHWTCALIKIAAHLNASPATKPLQQNSLRQEHSNLAKCNLESGLLASVLLIRHGYLCCHSSSTALIAGCNRQAKQTSQRLAPLEMFGSFPEHNPCEWPTPASSLP